MSSTESPSESLQSKPRLGLFAEMRVLEDWWAIWCASILLIGSLAAVWVTSPTDLSEKLAAGEKVKLTNPLKPYVGKPSSWVSNPQQAFYQPAQDGIEAVNNIPGILGSFLLIGVLFAFANQMRGKSGWKFLEGFPPMFILATIAYAMSTQEVVNAYNLEYALWALLLGLVISNTLGTPQFLRPAMSTEFYIKTGLVLLGAEVLMGQLMALGVPGIFVAWVVTPIVLISTFVFGQKVLKMESPSLNMVISADMSVCGVSAAIATAAACKAKKEELSLAIGMSLSFTVLMMVLMPVAIKAIGMDEQLGGAWIGGTIDSTGAVAVAGAALGDKALEVAATVKMIQNILIGVIAFGVSIFWVTRVEKDASGAQPSAMEIWYRFPKFVLGFMAASIAFSLLDTQMEAGPNLVKATIDGSTKTLRGWLFCLAFVSIGLETNFRELLPFMRGGKPLVLYVCGQTLNLALTLFMAWLMFKVIFAV